MAESVCGIFFVLVHFGGSLITSVKGGRGVLVWFFMGIEGVIIFKFK